MGTCVDCVDLVALVPYLAVPCSMQNYILLVFMLYILSISKTIIKAKENSSENLLALVSQAIKK